jgi:hypothetical protein
VIVISGALVLVALVLLVIGLVSPELGFVYASIGVSLASFAFLVAGILQRRKEDLSGETSLALPGTDTVKAGLGSVGDRALDRDNNAVEGVATLQPVATPPADVAGPKSGTVLVVAGRPRYHVEGCRYLTGKQADALDVKDAREQGFTACGVCKPDESLSSAAPTATPDVVEVVDEVKVAEEAPVTPARVARTTTATPTTAAKKAPAKAAPVKTADVKVAAKAAAVKAPTKAAVKTAPAKKAAAAPVKRGTVIVIPDRGKFHTPDCRYVRGAEDTLELTKAQAARQGYDACGVCNP